VSIETHDLSDLCEHLLSQCPRIANAIANVTDPGL
jgi:hypothetical protein